jgi:hypothetical protein
MKKLVSILLVLVLVIGLAGTVSAEGVITAEEYEKEYIAAPAVAGLLLEAAGIDNRYGTGRDGGNYISDVAREMGPETDFHNVTKEDEIEYAKAVARYLRSKGLNVGAGLFKAELLSVWYVGTSDTFGTHAGETLTMTFSNDVHFTREYPWIIFSGVATIGTGPLNWSIVDGNKVVITSTGTFINPRPKVGDLVTGFQYILDELENPVTVPAGGVVVQGDYVPYDLTGTWDVNLYINGTLYARFIKIDSQVDGEFVGEMGAGTTAQGNITGSVDGRKVDMNYDRIGYTTDGYFAEFTGTLAWDGNSASGTWKHGNNGVYRSDMNLTWTMTKR